MQLAQGVRHMLGDVDADLLHHRRRKRVAIVERDQRLGGTCLLRGCIPTKALLRSAEVLDTVERASEWGIKASGEPDWSAIQTFQDATVDKLVKGVTGLVKLRGIDVLTGTARLRPGPGLEVDGAAVATTDIVVATGSAPRMLPGLQVGPRVITSDEALRLDRIPTSVIVIGAGAVGLEFASLYRSFGADVTVLEALPGLAPLEDEAVSKEVARVFRKRGIATAVGASVTSIVDDGTGATVTYQVGDAPTSVDGRHLPGRGRPGPGDRGPRSRGGRALDAPERLRRGRRPAADDVPHIWAVGDVAATPLQLAHVAFTEGIAVAERIAGIDVAADRLRQYPARHLQPSRGRQRRPHRGTGPGRGSTGRDREARSSRDRKGQHRRRGRLGEGGGRGRTTGRVLGVHMIGPHVTDLIAEAMLITSWEASPSDVAAHIHPHPSLSEGLGEAMLALAGKALHTA